MAKFSLLALLALSAGLFALVNADAIYSKQSPVLQVTAKSYDSLIAQSNHTSILEFYAPWCGHCQNLKPVYEKAAKNLAGLAQVAAINCDEDSNKPFCGQMGVQGFPTLKIIKPGKKPGRPLVEDYAGQRTAKAIVEAVVDKIPNHVKKLQGNDLQAWLDGAKGTARAILFSEKGTISALIKSVAVDFLGGIEIAQMKNTDTAAVEKFGVTQFPALVLVQGDERDAVTYNGEMKKDALVAFLSQVTPPNSGSPMKKTKSTSSSKSAKPSTASSSAASSTFSEAAEAYDAHDYEDLLMHAETIILDDNTPMDSPVTVIPAAETPAAAPRTASIPVLTTSEQLESACLSPKSGNCILVLLPRAEDEATLSQHAKEVLSNLAEIADKHVKRSAKIFPFYGVPADNEAATTIREGLALKPETELEVIAVNMKRKWWRSYSAAGNDVRSLDGFVDGIKLGEGVKQSLPAGFFAQDGAQTQTEPIKDAPEPALEPDVSGEASRPADSEPEPPVEIKHGEL